MPSVALTNITPPRVSLIDPRTGLISREWYRFFLNLFELTGSGQNTTSLTDLQVGPPSPTQEDLTEINIDISALALQPTQTSALDQIAELYKVVQGLLLQPDQAATVEQIAEITKSLQALALQPRPELGTMSALQQAWLPWVTFDNAPEVTPPNVGTVAWDGGTTLGVQMTANVLGRVNESGYYYIKASGAITKGDVVMFTGAVGASGVPTGAPATGVTNGSDIMGIAAESLALNDFGLVQFIGTLRGVNLSAYADGDILWYNPAVTGGLTKTEPSAPNVKVQMAAVISATNNGTMLIRITAGSKLGGTDSNVQFGTLANGDLIQYDTGVGYWKNVAASSIAIGTATNLAGGAAGSVPYQTGAGATTFLGIGTAAQVLKVNSGATAPEWVNGAALTKTDDTNVTLTLGGSATTSLLAATSLTLGWTGQLAVSRGGTGVSTATANYVFAGPTSGGPSAPAFRALVAGDIPSLSYVTSVSGTAPISSSGGLTPAISISQATSSTNGYLSSTDWNTFNNKQSVAAPVTKTADFTVASTDLWLINNKSGSTCTVTLPAASSSTGRVLYFLNYQAYTVVSASSNVVPLVGGAAGTAILAAVAGDTATLVSDGTNWIMTQYTPNNVLLLE
jgi:hypothetical protein